MVPLSLSLQSINNTRLWAERFKVKPKEAALGAHPLVTYCCPHISAGEQGSLSLVSPCSGNQGGDEEFLHWVEDQHCSCQLDLF